MNSSSLSMAHIHEQRGKCTLAMYIAAFMILIYPTIRINSLALSRLQVLVYLICIQNRGNFFTPEPGQDHMLPLNNKMQVFCHNWFQFFFSHSSALSYCLSFSVLRQINLFIWYRTVNSEALQKDQLHNCIKCTCKLYLIPLLYSWPIFLPFVFNCTSGMLLCRVYFIHIRI